MKVSQQFDAWVKEASRLDALKRAVTKTGPQNVVPPAVPAAAVPKPDLRARIGAPKPGATPAPAPATPPPAPAAPAPASVADRKAALRGGGPGAGPGDGVDARFATQTVQQTRGAIGSNNLIVDAARAQALAPQAANPFKPQGMFARPVVAPPQAMLDAQARLRTQAQGWVQGHGEGAAEALRERAIAGMTRTASDGSDGAVVRKHDFAGIEIGIETDTGQARHWRDPKSGEDRATIMRFPYGFVYNTRGMDDGSVDVFVGPVSDAKNAYVILINKPPAFDTPDEEKVFLGFTNLYDAIGAFLQHYGNEERFIRKVSVVPVTELQKSLKDDGVTGTPEGSTKTGESHDTPPGKQTVPGVWSGYGVRYVRDGKTYVVPTEMGIRGKTSVRVSWRGKDDEVWVRRPDDEETSIELAGPAKLDTEASDPVEGVVAALEDKPVIDEEQVKEAAAFFARVFGRKYASALPGDAEAYDRRFRARTKSAAEPAATNIPGFAPHGTATEQGEPDTGSVQDEVPDNTIYPDTSIENMFRGVATDAMQTDHLIRPADFAGGGF